MYICWFNFDALAHGNAYKPTKEPMNYRWPDGDRTHDLQTEATPPAASCLACSLQATEIASTNATPMTCPRLHWTTDNRSGMHRCQFQHLWVLILSCALALAIYIFVGLILMLWHGETHTNPQRNRLIIVDPAGIELTTSRLRQLCQLSSTYASRHWNCVKNATPMTCPKLHWTTDNPSGMHRCQFQHLCM